MKKVVLSMKKSHENNCAGAFFLINCQATGLQRYLKRDFDANYFRVNVEEFSR